MFRTFAKVPGIGAAKLFLFHPTDLIALLELAWDHRAEGVGLPLGHPLHRSDLTRFGDTWFGNLAFSAPAPPTRPELPNLGLILEALGAGRDRPRPGGIRGAGHGAARRARPLVRALAAARRARVRGRISRHRDER